MFLTPYIYIIRLYPENGKVVWHSRFSKEKLERIQHWATKVVLELQKVHYMDRLTKLDTLLVLQKSKGEDDRMLHVCDISVNFLPRDTNLITGDQFQIKNIKIVIMLPQEICCLSE